MATSTDGQTWTFVEVAVATFADSGMTGRTADSSLLVAVGKSGSRDGAIWTFSP